MLLRSFLLIVVFCGGLQMMSNPGGGATRTDDGDSGVEQRRRRAHRSTTTTTTGATGDDCTRVAASFVRITGHDSHTMPSQKINDGDLEVCQMFGQHKTCCTRLMERRLHQAAMEDMRDIIASTSQHLKDLLVTNSELYENEFLKLLSAVSNNDTRLLLSRTYKIPSVEIDILVGKLFAELRSFMQHDVNDIRSSVAAFFDSLFSAVYIYSINESDGTLVPDDQRSCLKNARKDLVPAPFSEAIQQLNQDLIRSLGVARSLLDAFELAIEVINTTDHLHFEHQCSRGIARLLYCSYCDGHLDVRPCRNFCMNVAHGCLAQVVELNAHWNLFVDAVEKLVVSMRGSFDLQDVMTLFHSRISDSVMLTVANTQKYHSQVVPRCGSLVRVSSNTTSLHPSNGSHHRAAHGQPTTTTRASEVKLHRKIEMFVKNLADSRGFYENLPDTVCSSEKLSAGNYDSCWNGTSLGMYTKPVPVQEFSAQVAENPEMRVPDSKQSVILSLTEKLDNMTKILYSRVIPKPPPMQSDESSRDFLEHSGDWRVASGDRSEGGDDDEEIESESGSGSSSGDFSEPGETQPTGPGSRDGSRGASSGVIIVTNTDFDFTEKPSMKSHSPYVTKAQPDVVTVIYTGTGSTLKFPCYGSLLATFSILIVVYRICW